MFYLFFFIGHPGNVGLSENIISQTSLESCLEEARTLLLKNDFASLVADTPSYALNQDKVDTSTFLPKDADCSVDIYIICSSEDIESCSLLQNIITSQNESFVVKTSASENASTRLTYLDKARLVIPLLSSSFIQSSELVHELNIAWCRQRDCSSLCFLAIVLEQLPKNPTYVSLFPCFFNCADDFWTKDRETLKLFSSDELTRVYRSCQSPLNVVLCFMSAVDHIQRWNDGEHCPVLGLHNKLFNCLHLNECIQRYKEILSKRDNKEGENSTMVVSCTGSQEVGDEMICAVNDDSSKPTKLEHVGQNNVKSQDAAQEVKITEERNTIVQTTKSVASPVVQDERNLQDDTNNVLDYSEDVQQKDEHDNVEQNEGQSHDQAPPKEEQITEETSTFLQAADPEENTVVKIKTSQEGDTNNAVSSSQDVHQNTRDKTEAVDMKEKQPQSMSSKSKSSTCIMI